MDDLDGAIHKDERVTTAAAINKRNVFRLHQEIVPSENITARLLERPMAPNSKHIDEEPRFAELCDVVARLLSRRQGNHVFLVGERGIGEFILPFELARRAVLGQSPALANAQFLLVECRFVTPDESRERLAAILSSVASRPDLIVCFNQFASLFRTERFGCYNKGLLLSILSRSRCRTIGLLTPGQYEELVFNDADMREFFTRVDVAEPNHAISRKLLRHFARGMEVKFGFRVEQEAIDQAVTLTANYMLSERLPSKAVRVLHRICEDIEYDRSYLGSTKDRVTPDDVVRAVSAATGVPVETLQGIAEEADYESLLASQVVGQEHVVREVAAELGLIKAGLTDADKPASVMLFIGLTGTGKTEMAKALAQALFELQAAENLHARQFHRAAQRFRADWRSAGLRGA